VRNTDEQSIKARGPILDRRLTPGRFLQFFNINEAYLDLNLCFQTYLDNG